MTLESLIKCTACLATKPKDEFGVRRRRGRVERMNECRPCKRQRDREAYATQDKRKEQIARNRKADSVKAHSALSEYRSNMSCADCSKLGTETKIVFYLAGSKAVSNRVRDANSVGRVISTAKAGTPLCAVCLGRRLSPIGHDRRYGLMLSHKTEQQGTSEQKKGVPPC